MAALQLVKRPSLLYNGYRMSFSVVKWPGHGIDNPPPWYLACLKMGTCFCFLQEVQFRILPCTADNFPFTDRGEGSPIPKLTFHKNYVFVSNVLNPLACTAIIWYCYWSSYLLHFFQTVPTKFFFFLFLICAACCGLYFNWCSCLWQAVQYIY